jgi:hypothetical protein
MEMRKILKPYGMRPIFNTNCPGNDFCGVICYFMITDPDKVLDLGLAPFRANKALVKDFVKSVFPKNYTFQIANIKNLHPLFIPKHSQHFVYKRNDQNVVPIWRVEFVKKL